MHTSPSEHPREYADVPSIELSVDALLFDMDGTLVDSLEAVEQTWAEWAREFGVDAPDLALHHGRTAASIVADLMGECATEESQRRIDELEADPALPCSSMPGARELVGSLPERRWGVVTSAVRAVALSRLGKAGFGFPPVLVTGDEVSRGKPDPEPFSLGRERIGAPEREGVVVIAFEDTVTGLRSAKAAGCITVGVIGTETYDSLSAHADYVVASLEAVQVAGTGASGVRLRIFG